MGEKLTHTPLYRDWLNLSFHLLWCYERQLSRDLEPLSVCNNSGAWLVRAGWAEVQHDGQCWRATPGQWLIVKPTDRIQQFSPNAKILSIAFDAQWPDTSHLISKGLSIILNAEEYPSLERYALTLIRKMKKLAPESWDARGHMVDFYGYMQLQEKLSQWLTALVDALRNAGLKLHIRQNIDERVLQVVRIIDDRSFAEPVNIEFLAEQVGMSSVHLTRLFKEQLNVTPVSYFNRLRVEQAKRRLHVPGVRVKEVAIELGFFHLSHFSRWFKHHVGMPPRAFAHVDGSASSRALNDNMN